VVANTLSVFHGNLVFMIALIECALKVYKYCVCMLEVCVGRSSDASDDSAHPL